MSRSKMRYQYTDDFIVGLQWMWGEGHLSPGGPEEVAKLLHGVSVKGRDVLDIGSGLGGLDGVVVEGLRLDAIAPVHSVRASLVELPRADDHA